MHMINDNKISFDKEIVDYIKKINFEEKIKTLVLDEYSITNENVSPINLVKEKYCLQICDEILNKLQFLKARVVKNTIESLKELDIKKQDKFTSEQLEVYDKIIWMYQNSKFISIDELKKLVDEFDFNLNPYEINYILSRFILYANDISFASKKLDL